MTNYNPSPKADFQSDPKNVENHRAVVTNPVVRKGLEVALAQMQRQIADSAPPEMGACAAAHLRCLGAHDLLAIFYGLADASMPTVVRADRDNLAGNKKN